MSKSILVIGIEICSREARDIIQQVGRFSAARAVIVMTDGFSMDVVDQPAAALHQTEAIVFAVGIGPLINETELEIIASSNATKFTVADYSAAEGITSSLADITDLLSGVLCEEVEEYVEVFAEQNGLNEPVFNLTGSSYNPRHPKTNLILTTVTLTTVIMPILLAILTYKT